MCSVGVDDFGEAPLASFNLSRHAIASAWFWGFADGRAGRRQPGGEQVAEPVSGVGSHAGEDVLVGGHGEVGVGVTEPFGHDLDRCA